MKRTLRVLSRSPVETVAVAILSLIVLLSLLAPLIAPRSPLQTDLPVLLRAPSLAHPFGTDELGRDLLSRMLYGGRLALLTAAGATLVAGGIGVPLGLLGGYFGGWLDASIMRVIDVLLAIPSILIALGLVVMFGRGTVNVIVAVGVVGIPSFARLTRGSTLATKAEDFVLATEAVGAKHGYILVRTILPNVLDPVLVQIAVTAATAILLASSLSFLGIGIQPPTPDWGAMLSTGRSYLSQAPWYVLFPGGAVAVTVFCLDELSKFLQRLLRAEAGSEISL